MAKPKEYTAEFFKPRKAVTFVNRPDIMVLMDVEEYEQAVKDFETKNLIKIDNQEVNKQHIFSFRDAPLDAAIREQMPSELSAIYAKTVEAYKQKLKRLPGDDDCLAMALAVLNNGLKEEAKKEEDKKPIPQEEA